ncbi:MAG: tetratricopeptide repeat protein [Gammaproteobacteria bacterium]|nr:tetratricopeptide repeat protein [Gammaproteobacteria bacterium]
MNTNRLALLVVGIATIFSTACSRQESTDTSMPAETETSESRNELATRAGAPLFEGMGDHHHAITTSDPDAQRYFDQGLVIDFAFNHAESVRSFRAAQTLDPECAMCYWGEALALGPNINVTSNGKVVMADDERIAAFAAIQKALALKDKVTPAERDYIDALATRYNGDPATPREPLDQAWASAMRDLHHKYPDDDDAAAVFAESLMNTMPWDYWLDPDNPKPLTEEVISALETVLDRSPTHPLAIHLYIHAMEASSQPERAEGPADQLQDLVPGAGHLVHMPSHIYWRVGRYADASLANVKAAAVDEEYIAACNAQGFYPAAYYPHNIHFLWAASSMEGRSAVAIEAGRKVAANVQLEMIDQFPGVEFFKTIPMQSLVQFGRWDDVLAEPQPPENLEYSNGIWHYARAVAYARTGNIEAARAEQAMLGPIKEEADVLFLDTIQYPASMLLEIADSLALGEIAMADNDFGAATSHFERAVSVQDELPYTEPPFWYYPTRHSLGKALLAAGNAAEAEAVYRSDLEKYPRNGWAMFGLIQALDAQSKDASDIQKRFDAIWSQADVELTASRF